MLQCYSVMARAFYIEEYKRGRKKKECVCVQFKCSIGFFYPVSLSAYDCLKIAADGPSVFPFSKHPLFLFSEKKKTPSTNFGYYMFQLSYSLSPHPPTFRYYSFLFWGGGSSSWTPATLQTRAPKHTQESPIATACFGTRDTSQTIGSRRSLIKFERSIQSSPTQKKKRYGLRIYLSSSKRRAEPPETDPHIQTRRCKSQKR